MHEFEFVVVKQLDISELDSDLIDPSGVDSALEVAVHGFKVLLLVDNCNIEEVPKQLGYVKPCV